MKLLLILSLIITAAALTSCSESTASPSTEHAAAPENGAQFKEGKGVALTALMAESIRLQTAEVAEEKIAPAFTGPAGVVRAAGTGERSGQRGEVQPG